MAKDTTSRRAWQRMLSGRRLDLLDPSPLDLEIEDIAHGLSRVARWNGQTHGPHAYSVAEHSLLVEHLLGLMKKDAPADWRLAALLHDAPEYVIGDLVSPFKAMIGGDYKSLENRLLSAIHRRFGLAAEMPAGVTRAIKRADKAAAWFEATQLAGFTEEEAGRYFPPPRIEAGIAVKLAPLSPDLAKRAFLNRFTELIPATGPDR